MVRWMRWHFPPDTGFEIWALVVWSRARYLSVKEVPHNIDSLRVSWEETFCFEGQNGVRTSDLRLSKQAALTTASGPSPQLWSRFINHGIGSWGADSSAMSHDVVTWCGHMTASVLSGVRGQGPMSVSRVARRGGWRQIGQIWWLVVSARWGACRQCGAIKYHNFGFNKDNH